MAGKYDAFRQGVEPGGMFTTADVRLLVCYLLHTLKEPVSKQVLTDALCEAGLANYFEIASAADVLVEQGNTVKKAVGETEKYTISPAGAQIAETLKMDLSKSVREKALKYTMYYATLEKRRSENEITVEKAENGEYKVTLQVGKGRDRILALTFFVPTSDQVETLKKGFLLHVDELCQGIFDTLLKEPGAPPSPGKKSQP